MTSPIWKSGRKLAHIKSGPKARGRKPKKASSGQREMLMATSNKAEGKAKPAAKETKRPARHRKAG